MPYTTFNADSLTGGAARALDAIAALTSLVVGDRAICLVSGVVSTYVYSEGTAAENTTTHPFIVRPDDYVANGNKGNWTEQIPLSIGSTGVQNATLPAFLAIPAGTQADIATGAAPGVTVVWGTEVYDQGANFAANTFTAPVTGKYHFDVGVMLANIDTAAAYYLLLLTIPARSTRVYYDIMTPLLSADGTYWMLKISVLANMTATDTAVVSLIQPDGTAQTDILATSYFSGYLVC